MLSPNNPEIDIHSLVEKVKGLSKDRQWPGPLPSAPLDAGALASHEPEPAFQSQAFHGFSGKTKMIAFLKRIPVLGPVTAHCYRRLRQATMPGMSLKQRVLVFPVFGPLIGFAYSVLRLNTTRQQVAAGLAELHHMQAVTGSRLDQLEAIGFVNRLHRLESTASLNHDRLKVLETADIDRNVRLHHLEYADRHKNDRLISLENVNTHHRLNQLESMDSDNRLRLLEAIDIENRLMQLSELRNRLGQAEETLRLRLAEQENRVASMQREWRNRARELSAPQSAAPSPQPGAAAAGLPSADPAANLPVDPAAAVTNSAVDIDNFYVEFEGVFRGTRDDIRERLKVYLPYLGHLARDPGARVVDVGCGRGEWMELMAEQGIKAIGIDLNSAMVEMCRELGFSAECSDAIAWLRAQPAGSVAAVTGFHIIEHLPFETMLDLFDAALHALRDDGLIIFETPNPENLSVGSFGFYYDPTHRNPIVPAVAEFIARQRGFARAEVLRLHPFPATHQLSEDSEAARSINRMFFGPQDFAVLGWKTHAN